MFVISKVTWLNPFKLIRIYSLICRDAGFKIFINFAFYIDVRTLNKPSRDKLKLRLVKPSFSAARLVLVLLKTSRLQAARLVLLVPKLYRGLAPKL